MKKDLDDVEYIYEIAVPTFDSTQVQNLTFNASADDATFKFNFIYSDVEERWSGWVTMPDLSVRLLGVIPGELNWSRFTDWSLIFNYDGQDIALDSLSGASILLLKWEE